ncbi:MAG: hypothetical protein DRP65_07210 [Planctomycetota bacterium]|nr:MAG: hypothetical protein DRP65_07210 [Planctomycetota bacterium]
MTVSELVAMLQDCPPDTAVKFESSSGQIHDLHFAVAVDIFDASRCIMLCNDAGYICGPQEIKRSNKPDKAAMLERYNLKKAAGKKAEQRFQRTLKLRAKLGVGG